MVKSMIFLSLYAVAGVGSWGAYSFISEQDTSLDTLTKIAHEYKSDLKSQITEEESSNIVYRWKDAKGTWNYEDAPYSELNFKDYEDELKFLQALKESQRANQKSTEKEDVVAKSDSDSPISQIQKLFQDAKNVEKLLNVRKEQMDQITNSN